LAPNINGSTINAQTVKLEWFNPIGNVRTGEKTDSSCNPSAPAYVTSKPPIGSSAFLEGSNGTGYIAAIDCPKDSIIDIHMTHWFQDRAIVVTRPILAGLLGAYYWFAADGSANNFVPVALSTTN
jgi:hypothetical protein